MAKTLMLITPATMDKVELAIMAARGVEPRWRYLRSFDLDGDHGHGVIVTTPQRALAMRFDSLEAAMEAWRRQSAKYPLRPDGKPNRPLTAYHATFEEAADEQAE